MFIWKMSLFAFGSSSSNLFSIFFHLINSQSQRNEMKRQIATSFLTTKKKWKKRSSEKKIRDENKTNFSLYHFRNDKNEDEKSHCLIESIFFYSFINKTSHFNCFCLLFSIFGKKWLKFEKKGKEKSNIYFVYFTICPMYIFVSFLYPPFSYCCPVHVNAFPFREI